MNARLRILPHQPVPALMAALAAEMRDTIGSASGAQSLPLAGTPPHDAALTWTNHLFRAADFRRAHVELFSAPDRFAVLHVCIFPHVHTPASIFGFDMIAGVDISTGIFLDFSAPARALPWPDLTAVIPEEIRTQFAIPRALPEWGHIFSPAMLAIRPRDQSEIAKAAALARTALYYYLNELGKAMTAPRDAAGIKQQTDYVLSQRNNEHTFRMLSRFVGAKSARAFIDSVLFPLSVEEHDECAPRARARPETPLIQTPQLVPTRR